jgi:hypothetical protein
MGAFMRRTIPTCLIVLLVVASSACAQRAGSGGSLDGLKKFWSEFRGAVLAGEQAKVVALTQFPFKTRGMMDSAAVVMHDTAAFQTLFPKMLEQDTGLAREPEPMHRLIERTPTVTRKHLSSGGKTARIGNFVFQHVDDTWRFTMAYVEEE